MITYKHVAPTELIYRNVIALLQTCRPEGTLLSRVVWICLGHKGICPAGAYLSRVAAVCL
jgi:hypothetical protein